MSKNLEKEEGVQEVDLATRSKRPWSSQVLLCAEFFVFSGVLENSDNATFSISGASLGSTDALK